MTKHSTTSTELDIFHQIGHLRHSVSNTDTTHSTMYSKNTAQDESVEEQRQEIITFRLPQRTSEQITEETYETTVTTETQPDIHQFQETRSQKTHEDVDTQFTRTEITEWSRSLGTGTTKTSIDTTKQERSRPRSPEELVEESYEVVSTLAKPHDADFLITVSSPRSTTVSSAATTQRYTDLSAGKLLSSEDDSSYCEEWTVTEAKRKQDGQTVKTIIDRGGHHRYSIEAETTAASTKDTSTSTTSQLRHHSG